MGCDCDCVQLAKRCGLTLPQVFCAVATSLQPGAISGAIVVCGLPHALPRLTWAGRAVMGSWFFPRECGCHLCQGHRPAAELEACEPLQHLLLMMPRGCLCCRHASTTRGRPCWGPAAATCWGPTPEAGAPCQPQQAGPAAGCRAPLPQEQQEGPRREARQGQRQNQGQQKRRQVQPLSLMDGLLYAQHIALQTGFSQHNFLLLG